MAKILELKQLQAAAGPKPFRVLLVEPSHAQAQLIQQWLAATGDVSLNYCKTCADGVQALRSGYWDLVVADADLVDLAGGKVGESLNLSGYGAPVLLLAHEQSMEIVQKALRYRAEGLLFAPFNPTEFVEQALTLAYEAQARRLRDRKVVLAIGAHPDDVEIGCGGALARHRSRGDDVLILTLSRGDHGGDAAVRSAESEAAAAMLGARLKLADLPDSRITEGIETIAVIESTVRALSPTHVYTHSRHDAHQDHRNVHLASVVGARNVPNLYCYQAPSSTIEFQPNLFIDIALHINQKLDAIAAYESQLARSASLKADNLLATARYWGRYTGYGLAEPMEVIRQWER